MNRTCSFSTFTNVFYIYLVLLIVGDCQNATFCFSFATKIETVSARGRSKWLPTLRFQYPSSRANRCHVHHSSQYNISFNTTKIAEPSAKPSDEIANILVQKVKETVGHTGTFTSFRMIVEQFVRQVERVSERTFEPATERTLERATEKTWKRATERTLERVAERSYERIGERAMERAGERVLERTGKRAIERAGESVLKRTGEQTLERASDRVLNQLGKKVLIKQSEKKAIVASISEVRRTLFGKFFGQSAVRIGRGLTIALPILGGMFALYLFQSDIQRVKEESRKRLCQPLRSDKMINDHGTL